MSNTGKWIRSGEGRYQLRDGKIDALVIQKGEFWINDVYYDGELVDRGLWDSRDVAFSNTHTALRKLEDFYHICDRQNVALSGVNGE